MRGEALFDERAEALAIDRKRAAGGHGGLACRGDDERIEPHEFFFEQSDGVLERCAAHRVGTHEFREHVGLMRRPAFARAHLEEIHRDTSLRGLPRGFAARKSAADNRERFKLQRLRVPVLLQYRPTIRHQGSPPQAT